MELNNTGKALVALLFFRFVFGGYTAGMDQYSYTDVESALTVLLIYALLGIFAVLFLLGKRIGVIGIIGLDAIFIFLQSVFTVTSLMHITAAGPHDPLNNAGAAVLMFGFSALTLILAIKIYRENKIGKKQPLTPEKK